MFKNLPPTTSERGKNLPPSGPGGKNPPPAGGTYLTGYKGTCLRMYPPATCGGGYLNRSLSILFKYVPPSQNTL